MMSIVVKQLCKDGFLVTDKRRDCTYMARGADNRVVMIDGTVKRGQPHHRGSYNESKNKGRR